MIVIDDIVDSPNPLPEEVETNYYVPLVVRFVTDERRHLIGWVWTIGYMDDNFIEFAFLEDNSLAYVTCVNLIRCPPSRLESHDAREGPVATIRAIRPIGLRGEEGAMGGIAGSELQHVNCTLHKDQIQISWYTPSPVEVISAINVCQRTRLLVDESSRFVGIEVAHLTDQEMAELRDYFARHDESK